MSAEVLPMVSEFRQPQIELMKSTVAKGLSDQEFSLFLSVAQRRGLDPILRQIHAVKRKIKNQDGTYREQMNIQTGIDGYRLIAARTGEYAGSDEPKFEGSEKYPKSCSVTVYRIVQGHRVGYTASAFWDEYFPGDASTQAFMWKKMPRGQLAKCAEALALRKGFPGELSGVHVDDEMHQVDEAPLKRVSRASAKIPKATSAHRSDQSEVETCDCGNQMMVSKLNDGEWYCNPRNSGCGAKRPRG